VVEQDKPTVTLRAPKFEADYRNHKLAFSEGINGELVGMGANPGHFAVNQIAYDLVTGKLIGAGGAKFVQGRTRPKRSRSSWTRMPGRCG